MPIDLDKVVGAELVAEDFSWTDEDVILYNLGVGAGNPPTDPLELKYTYEGDLQAVPTYGTIPPFGMMMSMGMVEGFDVNLTQILHGEQELIVHSRIPTSGTVTQSGRVVGVFDKGKGGPGGRGDCLGAGKDRRASLHESVFGLHQGRGRLRWQVGPAPGRRSAGS